MAITRNTRSNPAVTFASISSGNIPELMDVVNHLTDEQLRKHAPRRPRSAKRFTRPTKQRSNTRASPRSFWPRRSRVTGFGEAGEGRNITHQQKKLNEKELREFRARFDIPISDEEIAETPFYRPPADSPETKYLLERRKKLGGFLPKREVRRQAAADSGASILSPSSSKDRASERLPRPWRSFVC